MNDLQTNTETQVAKRALCFSKDKSIEITVATNAGACFGVVRAIKLGRQSVAKKSRKADAQVFSFGPLIHNPMVVGELTEKGLQIAESAEEVSGGTVVLRSHGVRKEIEKSFKDRGVKIVDATCPLVKKPQRIAQGLAEKGYFLVLVGDKKHPEVNGVISYYSKPDYLVTYNPDDVALIPEGVEKVGILAQTTIEVGVFDQIVEKCRARFSEVAVHNTICDATSVRQNEAATLSQEADIMIVVGGKNSSNTKKLEKICKLYQPTTYLIEVKEEIDPAWFSGKFKVGVTGGASTPEDYVDEVGTYIATLLQ